MGLYWVRSDPCGLFSANLTVLLILYAQFVVIKILLLPWYGFGFHVLLYLITSALALISHTRAQFSDPGAVPENHVSIAYPNAVAEAMAPIVSSSSTNSATNTTQSNPAQSPQTNSPSNATARVCRRCKIVKPARAHHCSTCARCVVKMDHHCPWVNNCVAVFNQKYFILFLFYTGFCCFYSVVLLIGRFVSCTNNLRTCTVSGVHVALCVINFIEAVIFGLFVSIMLWDQMSAIYENTPGIDALQHRMGPKRSMYLSLKEVFGEPLSWRWLLPLTLPKQVHDDFQMELQQDEVLTREPPKQV